MDSLQNRCIVYLSFVHGLLFIDDDVICIVLLYLMGAFKLFYSA